MDNHAPVMQLELRVEQREVARNRILTGARAVLVERGFEGTIDDVAVAAGVSRRTVFRHFPTHDELLVEAIREIVSTVRSSVPGPPQPGEDVESWLTETAVQLHTLHAQLVGRAFWDVHVPRSSVSPEIVAVLGDLEDRRRNYGTRLATGAWTSLGGSDHPPPLVIDAFLVQLSPFATHAFAQYSPEEVGRTCAKILWTVLVAALSQLHPNGPV
jgi:AcrR family transcriptional regulator